MSVDLDRELFEVDALLRRVAGSLSYPATPPISMAVRGRLQTRRSTAERAVDALAAVGMRPLQQAALGALALAVIAIGVSLAVPTSRSALADFFHLGHVRVERQPLIGPTPSSLSPQSFARPSTFIVAEQIADFPLRLPTRDNERLLPEEVYVQGETSSLPTIIFVYEDEGYDLYETRLSYFAKGGPDPSLIHDIQLDGQPAYWIDQGGHVASFLDEQGRVVVESRRSVERATLLWERDGITYRLETALSQTQAIQVAESLR